MSKPTEHCFVKEDCTWDNPKLLQGYPDNVCVRSVKDTIVAMVDQFKSNPSTASHFIGFKQAENDLEHHPFRITANGVLTIS